MSPRLSYFTCSSIHGGLLFFPKGDSTTDGPREASVRMVINTGQSRFYAIVTPLKPFTEASIALVLLFRGGCSGLVF